MMCYQSLLFVFTLGRRVILWRAEKLPLGRVSNVGSKTYYRHLLLCGPTAGLADEWTSASFEALALGTLNQTREMDVGATMGATLQREKL